MRPCYQPANNAVALVLAGVCFLLGLLLGFLAGGGDVPAWARVQERPAQQYALPPATGRDSPAWIGR